MKKFITNEQEITTNGNGQDIIKETRIEDKPEHFAIEEARCLGFKEAIRQINYCKPEEAKKIIAMLFPF